MFGKRPFNGLAFAVKKAQGGSLRNGLPTRIVRENRLEDDRGALDRLRVGGEFHAPDTRLFKGAVLSFVVRNAGVAPLGADIEFRADARQSAQGKTPS